MFEEPTQPSYAKTPGNKSTPPPPEPAKSPESAQSPEPPRAVPKAPGKAEDIFASTEGEVKNPPIPGGTPAKVDEEIDREIFGPQKRSIIKPIIIGLVVVVILAGGYFAYAKFGTSIFKKAPTTEKAQPSPTKNTGGQKTPAVAPPKNPTPTQPTVLDADKDGLTDQEEKKLGTNPNNPDSDQDGLPDAAEVKVYHTNPLNSDSDGDGYSDGQEVRGGYDPNDAQPGAKLGDLQTEINKLKK